MSFLAGMWCGMVLMGAAVLGLTVWLAGHNPKRKSPQISAMAPLATAIAQDDEVRELERMARL